MYLVRFLCNGEQINTNPFNIFCEIPLVGDDVALNLNVCEMKRYTVLKRAFRFDENIKLRDRCVTVEIYLAEL